MSDFSFDLDQVFIEKPELDCVECPIVLQFPMTLYRRVGNDRLHDQLKEALLKLVVEFHG